MAAFTAFIAFFHVLAVITFWKNFFERLSRRVRCRLQEQMTGGAKSPLHHSPNTLAARLKAWAAEAQPGETSKSSSRKLTTFTAPSLNWAMFFFWNVLNLWNIKKTNLSHKVFECFWAKKHAGMGQFSNGVNSYSSNRTWPHWKNTHPICRYKKGSVGFKVVNWQSTKP